MEFGRGFLAALGTAAALAACGAGPSPLPPGTPSTPSTPTTTSTGSCTSSASCAQGQSCTGGKCVATSGTSTTTGACPSNPDTWGNYASSVFSSNCSGCHGFASSYSGVTSRSGTIEGVLAAGGMPPRGPLPAATEKRILDWFSCGAPQ